MPKRLKILSDTEIGKIYEQPIFSYEDQQYYFELTPQEEVVLSTIRKSASKFYFILQLGYFKSKQQFFTVDVLKMQEDIIYIHNIYFKTLEIIPRLALSKPTYILLHQKILNLLGYRLCDANIKEQLKILAKTAVNIDSKPMFLFKELVRFMQKNSVVLPGYSYLQDLISNTILEEEKRLKRIIEEYLTAEHTKNLIQLLHEKSSMYEITQLKKEPKSFALQQMTEEVKKIQQLSPLYNAIKPCIPLLKISQESIKYYASLLDYYSVYKIKRFPKYKALLYLMCFVYHRFQKANDNLIEAFMTRVHKYKKEAQFTAKEMAKQYQLDCNLRMKSASQVLSLFRTTDLDYSLFLNVKERAFKILPFYLLDGVISYMNKQVVDPTVYEWECYQKISRIFKRNLRQLVLNLEFSAEKKGKPILDRVLFLQQHLKTKKSLKECIPPMKGLKRNITKYIYEKTGNHKKTNPHKYEFMVYQQLKEGLEAGDIFVPESKSYRSFESDLIDDITLDNKMKDLQNLGFKKILTPIETLLAELQDELETRFIQVNERIKDKSNPYIRKEGNKWVLPYPVADETVNHPIYQQLPHTNIGDVLLHNHNYCSFLDVFTHILPRFQKNDLDSQTLIACIVAFGSYLGLGKMSHISDISYHALAGTANSFIRLETLRQANDIISNAIAKLPIYKYWKINDMLHASDDGSKMETQIHTFNARYSVKYFGLKKGISVMSLILNHGPINAMVIGSHEHESHYTFDILFNNTADIRPEILSTDTHGANHVNFALLYFFDYIYAPRYKDVGDKLKELCCFKAVSEYADFEIKPTHKINKSLIISEIRNMQRILASLAFKKTSQSLIVKKLSSYARKNRTKSALWEFDRIIQTIHFLRYIDEPVYRQSIQKALNRGESYHKLTTPD